LPRCRGGLSFVHPVIPVGTPGGASQQDMYEAADSLGRIAELERQLDQRTIERDEALERQSATADVLRIISRSAFDLQTVFATLIESAAKLCRADRAALLRLADNRFQVMATYGFPAEFRDYMMARGLDLDRGSASGRAALDRCTVHIPDILEDPDFTVQESQRRGGFRTVLAVPLLREGSPIGALFLTRATVELFTEQQIDLVTTFADQAVIAIENARLFDEVQARTRELSESLEQQTATAEVLSVISSSGGDLAPVFDAMLGKAMELCRTDFGVLNTYDGESFHTVATRGLPPAYDAYRRREPQIYGPGSAPVRLLHGEPIVEIADLLESEAYRKGEPNRVALVELGGARCLLAVPLLKDERVVGNLLIFRQENRRFSDKQIALLKQFAAQAVIAIENTRLLRELRASTEDLRESLQFQTATSDVLKVISRSPDALQPVLDVIVETARELCRSDAATIFLLRDEKFHVTAVSGALPTHLEFLRANPAPVDQTGSILSRVARQKRTLHYPNVADDPELRQGITGLGGPRALLTVPLMAGEQVIGAITLRQSHLKPFTKRQIEAIETFADQAVIAIGNVRLFEEVQAKTRDLTESLQQQTATAEVLKVISRSAFDLQTVLDTLVESAARLCEADMAAITRQQGNRYFRAGSYGFAAEFMEYVKDIPVEPERATITGRTLLEGKVIHVPDVHADSDYTFSEAQRLSGDPRTFLGVPLLREGKPVGALVLLRRDMRPFTEQQIELVSTFADQAVIAIENVRLFDQVQERTSELSQSLEDLRAAQDRLVQTEKLASLGQLTAGIAHEIKNPLNFVNNFAALSADLTEELNDLLRPAELAEGLREDVDELTGLLKDNLEKVVQHGKRADSIVKNMLLHSREGSGEHRPADVNALVEESLNLAWHGARAEKSQFNVTLERDFDPDAGSIEVFPQEITRVLLNLIANGFYAVARRARDNDDPGFDPVLRAGTRSLGDRVEIRIRDNGTGITPEVREKMFNPFFTTKPAGEGTGLGLSMSHDIIVKQHGGRIEVESEPGRFTEFIIVLPRSGNQTGKSGTSPRRGKVDAHRQVRGG
jgi:two-component system NtrC family sensor kinase